MKTFFQKIIFFFSSEHSWLFRNKRFVIMALILIAILLFIYFIKFARNYPSRIDLKHEPDFFGVTFSTKFTKEIGLDWQEVYLAILDDLKVKEIRLPIYWDEIEKEPGVFDFTKYDYIINEGEKRGVRFIVNVGWRLPRWPECHAPEWTNNKSVEMTRAKSLRMIITTIEHFKDRESIKAWQLENEPFFDAFGVCPKSDYSFFTKSLEAVRRLDNRPVIISATGELSMWRREAKLADIFGSTVYRVVWGPETGYIRYPIPAWFYGFKANLLQIPKDRRIIVELQAEPWSPEGSIIHLSEEEKNKSFNIEQFKANLQYAINIGFNKTYLWGVEWWYYQYKFGNPEYWRLARTIF